MQGEEQSHQPGLTPAERELEDALRGLRPSPAQIRRDRVLFDAGVAATARRASPRAVGLVAAGLALGVGLSVFWPSELPVERVVSGGAPATQPALLAHSSANQQVAPEEA